MTPLGVAGCLHVMHTSGELVTIAERERGGDGPVYGMHVCVLCVLFIVYCAYCLLCIVCIVYCVRVWTHVQSVCERCLNFHAIQISD